MKLNHSSQNVMYVVLVTAGSQAACGREGLSAGASFVEDFRSLSLTCLLFERLASRMRSDTHLDQTGFSEVVVESAKPGEKMILHLHKKSWPRRSSALRRHEITFTPWNTGALI